jgi:hypothetical protein
MSTFTSDDPPECPLSCQTDTSEDSITKNSNIFGWFYGNTMLSNSKNLELMVLLVMVISDRIPSVDVNT